MDETCCLDREDKNACRIMAGKLLGRVEDKCKGYR
jgi:hypothetical protein